MLLIGGAGGGLRAINADIILLKQAPIPFRALHYLHERRCLVVRMLRKWDFEDLSGFAADYFILFDTHNMRPFAYHNNALYGADAVSFRPVHVAPVGYLP